MSNYLHGIEVIEVDSGGRVVSSPSTSVIGVVGTMEGVGIEDKFPLNKPILVTKVQQIAGVTGGTVAGALRSIYNQAQAICVVVRVKGESSSSETLKSMAGDIASYSGVYALLLAEAEVKVKPKLLVAPYYSSIIEEGKISRLVHNMIDVADKLRGVAIIEGTNTTMQEVIDVSNQLGSTRCYMVDPSYVPTFDTKEGFVGSSSIVAGVFAKNDVEKGFWWSPSNTEVKGVTGLSRPISFNISDRTCEANLLNQKGIGTLVFSGGVYKLWGNRSLSKDNKWHFINVRRVVDTVYDAIDMSMVWAMDRPFSNNLFHDIESNLQNYLNNLVARGAILGGKVWVDTDENNVGTYTEGQLIVNFDIEPAAPVERLTFKAYRNNDYVKELFK